MILNSKTVSTSRFHFAVFALSAAVALSLPACAPTKDEKVLRGAGAGGNRTSGNGVTDSAIGDRSFEYSRAMLIELADVARQTETLLAAVQATNAPAPANAPASAPQGENVTTAPAALRAPGCRVAKTLPATEGTLKFEVVTQADPNVPSVRPDVVQGCTETGTTFKATQAGREISFATLAKKAGAPTLATFFKVQGVGFDTILIPKANEKDSLRVKSTRFLEAEFVEEVAGTRVYRFSYDNSGTYNLDLKSFYDNGTISTTIKGLLLTDMNGKVTGFRGVESFDRLNLVVESSRQIRSGGLERREFFGSLEAPELSLDLAACALPTGELKSRFTVKPLEGSKKYLVDSKKEFTASPGTIVDKLKPDAKKTRAQLCSATEQITVTELYAGLLY